MVRRVNHAMSFAIIAVFAVKLRCVLCVSKPGHHGICGLDNIRARG
jgi:hypothetical protein